LPDDHQVSSLWVFAAAAAYRFNGVLENCAEGRDPALGGFCKCSAIAEQAALSITPHAWADGLMLVFQHPFSRRYRGIYGLALKESTT
jgi:hypothetical protein